jgi:DNA-binding beta-propeller fold protein YncE
MAWIRALALLTVTWLAVAPAAAELALPPGFTAQVYVTGQGFDPSSERGVYGMPAVGTLGIDALGTLFLARTGARFRSGEVEDMFPIYRIPPGGGRLTPDTEARYLTGPPLPNPQVAAARGRGEVFVTTYDRDRRIGALYRMIDGRPQLLAGGTPLGGAAPLLRHPEGVGFDAAGNIYVTDREQGVVVRLDRTGKVLDPRYLTVTRPRMLTVDERGQLWIGTDGSAETPWQDGSGQLWRASPDGSLAMVLAGPLPAGLGLSTGGGLFMAQRRTGKILAVTPDGRRFDFAVAPEGTIIRTLAFAPVTPETRRAGIAGDLFVVAVPRQIWAINEVIRISGPFDEFVRQRESAAP